jgi:segregation and condensation protein B
MMDRMSTTLEPPAGESEIETSPIQPLGDEITAQSVVEALLLATDDPLPAGKIAQLLGMGDASDVKAHIEQLNEHYAQTGASFRIEAIAKGYQVLTLPAFNTWIQKLHKARDESRLSPAALETLAIVAYKQPILRADVEAIRGVAVGDMLIRLRDMGLVRIVGRAEEVGRPLLYGTTTKFLDIFGLASLKDLPKVDADQPNALPKIKLAD